MRYMISYFYQIRFFSRNMIPVSTAIWDPKWYHQSKDQSYFFKDKNGVWNGFREPLLNPSKDAGCSKDCSQDPTYCNFSRSYEEKLHKIDFDKFDSKYNKLAAYIQSKENFKEEPVIVFIVHETPLNPCSERLPLIRWFKENGRSLDEFVRSR